MQCFSSIMYGFIMDLGAVMLFTLSFISFRTFIFLLILEIVTISFVYKKTWNMVFSSSNNEEIPLPHEFIFVFIQYFTGAILLEKSWKKCGAWKNIIRAGRPYRGRGRGESSFEREFKPYACYGTSITLVMQHGIPNCIS